MHFTKVHGLGNDFILVDAISQQVQRANLQELAIRACDRHLGIGADGFVLLLSSEKADVQMRIFNPDGSEAQMCGNAIRCVARYLYEKKLVKSEVINVETLAGIVSPQVILSNGQFSGVRVDMGEPRLQREEIPMSGSSGTVINEPLQVGNDILYITAVSMGNPHCVIFVDDLKQIPFYELGPRIENHPVFPQRTNVEFIQVINQEELKMRVWERGAGATLACGTGACAAVIAGFLNGFTKKMAKVHLALGSLIIEWAQDDHVYMTGPAETVFYGELPEAS